MRLSALNGDTGWNVYDAKRCCEVRLVQWVDSSTAQWGKIEILPSILGVITTRMQEDRISIYPDRMLVIFNEVDDDDTKTTEVEKEIAKIA